MLQRNKRIKKVLITAGPTREMLDPVRFITNLSTGEMGYAIAREAKRRGLQVTLISGPTGLTPPPGVRFVPTVTVEDLQKALRRHFFRNDLLIMSAAVGDFVPAHRSLKKVQRRDSWKIIFKKTPDLVKKMAEKKGKRIVIGFALETEGWLKRSRRKLLTKNLDGIVANYYSPRHNPFGKTRVHAALVDRQGTRLLRMGSKQALAKPLLKWALAQAAGARKN